MDYTIGIDIGTSGTKTLIVREDGKIAAAAAAPYPLLTPKPGWAEQQPEWWAKAAAKTVKAALEKGKVNPRKVAGVSFSGQMHGMVALDAGNSVLRPAILWCDARTWRERAWLEKTVGMKKLLSTVCNPPLEGFTAPKLVWLRNNEPALFKKMAAFVLPKDYVRWTLTGELLMEESDAAGTALLNVPRGDWAWDVIDAAKLPRGIFRPVVRSVDPAGMITAAAARQTGLVQGTPVIAGGADNTCAAVGTGIVRPGTVSSSIGSSGVIFAYSDNPKIDPLTRVHTFNHSVPGKWYLMGVMISAGLSLKWFRDTFCELEKETEKRTGRDAYDQIAALAATAPIGADGVVFLPYLSGERTPHKNPHARGVLFGLSHVSGKAHAARAVMEGIVFGLKDSLDIIESAGGMKVREVRATGGGAKSPFWRQMQADVFGKKVYTLNHDEGPAYGAALIAASGVGVFSSVQSAVKKCVRTDDCCAPDAARHKKYAAAHTKFRSLYKSLEKEFRPE